jgi:hypothetical protein
LPIIQSFGSGNTIDVTADTGVVTQVQGQVIPTGSGLELLMIPISCLVLVKTLMNAFGGKQGKSQRLHARHWKIM